MVEQTERPGWSRYQDLGDQRRRNALARDELRERLAGQRAEQDRQHRRADHAGQGESAEQRASAEAARRAAEQAAVQAEALEQRITALWRNSTDLEDQQRRIAATWQDPDQHDRSDVADDVHEHGGAAGRAEQDARLVDDDGDGDGL